jgi:2-amino-4-hydroxy-6-hydroxymethyldihydropteridine diphosphokinase
MPIAYVALGSNLDSEHGTRAETLSAAAQRLETLGQIILRSSLYETEPVGFRDQAHFLNAVVALGRDRGRSVPKGPRTLDLDLLLMEDRTFVSEELTLPHPALAERRFVLAPLAEIAPDLRLPPTRQPIATLLADLPDQGENRKSAVTRLPQPW